MDKRKKTLAVSIIIPVYNEEDYLRLCLDSIANQSIKPLEVIVIDNNSTDRTVSIAKSYSFVTLLKETRQHQAFAQHTGFSAAKGDIFARIDADSILPIDWCENLIKAFEENPNTLAFSGSGKPYDFSLKKPAQYILDKYYIIAYHLAGHNMMWGSNCAFRSSVWPKINNQLSLRDDIWEDYDLAFCIGRFGKIELLKTIDVENSLRAVHKPIRFQLGYQFRSIRTFLIHRNKLRTAIFFFAWSSVVLFIPFVVLDRYIQSFAAQKRQQRRSAYSE